MSLKKSLPLEIRKTSRVLILGTMPGDESLRLQEYYANKNNQFWKILAEIYGEPIGVEYAERIEFIHRKGIGLWDVLRHAERKGSLDSEIQNGVVNDFTCLSKIYPGLTTIVFNGGDAQKLFRRNVQQLQRIAINNYLKLPSTSPTPGRHVLPYEAKVAQWKAIVNLGI